MRCEQTLREDRSTDMLRMPSQRTCLKSPKGSQDVRSASVFKGHGRLIVTAEARGGASLCGAVCVRFRLHCACAVRPSGVLIMDPVLDRGVWRVWYGLSGME
jgi:hypothetical protein